MKTRYEWDLEDADEHGDIHDHSFSDTLAPLWKWREGKALVLVRDETDNDGGRLERSWAYVKDGNLPEWFEDSGGSPTVKVPKRFHAEFAKVSSAV